MICLDSSGDEDEKVDSKLPTLGLRDGNANTKQLQNKMSPYQTAFGFVLLQI